MKNFTAIYSTAFHKDINFSFKAEDMTSAIEYCKQKFNVPVEIVCDDNDYLALSDTKALEGKTVTWKSIKGFGGVSTINKVDTTAVHPLSCTIISGDDLNGAFNQHFWLALDHVLCFSDADDFITIISEK